MCSVLFSALCSDVAETWRAKPGFLQLQAPRAEPSVWSPTHPPDGVVPSHPLFPSTSRPSANQRPFSSEPAILPGLPGACHWPQKLQEASYRDSTVPLGSFPLAARGIIRDHITATARAQLCLLPLWALKQGSGQRQSSLSPAMPGQALQILQVFCLPQAPLLYRFLTACCAKIRSLLTVKI